jgi:hypothetical protein
MSQFGSYYKRHLSRSILQVVQAGGGGIRLRQTKNNFAAMAEPFDIAITFNGVETITIERIEATDDRMAGIEQHVTAAERTYLALAEYEEGVTAEQLAQDLGVRLKTVKNHLTALRKAGRAVTEGGIWTVVTRSPGPDPFKDRDRDAARRGQPAPPCPACGFDLVVAIDAGRFRCPRPECATIFDASEVTP